MRLFLTIDEQNLLNPTLEKYNIKLPSSHRRYVYDNQKYIDTVSKYSYLTNGDIKICGQNIITYFSATIDDILNILPATIYCNDEYKAVDIHTARKYNTLKLHIIKNVDENPDIKFKYTVAYKPINNPTIKKRFRIKSYDYKDPEIEDDELIRALVNMFFWCANNGHIKKKK